MSVCCKLLKALTVILLTTSHVSSQAPELTNTLHSTVSSELVAFSNENITFTCVVRGSNALEWSSDQYIGTGGRRLEFISTDMPRDTQNAGETVAILDRAIQDTVIESRLFIRVQSGITSASVRCQDGGTGAMTSVTFRLADNDTSVTCDKQSVCPGEPVNCACATGSSNTLAWVIDRLEFRSNDPLLTRRSVDAFGILTNKHNNNRIQVLTSNLTVTASTDDTNLLIQCENVDGSTLNAIPVSILQSCPSPSEQITTSARNEASSATGTCAGPIAAAVVFPVISVGIVVLIVIIVFLMYKRKEIDLKEEFKKNLQDKERELQEEFEKNVQEKESQLQEEFKKQEGALKKEYEDKERKLEQERRGLRLQQTALNEKETRMQNDVDSLQRQLATARATETRMQNDVDSLQRQLATARTMETRMQNDVDSLKRQLATARATLKKEQQQNPK